MHKYTELSDQRQLGIAMKGLMGVNCLSGKSAFNGMQSCNHHLQFWQNAITSSSSDQCHSDQCSGEDATGAYQQNSMGPVGLQLL